MLRLLQFLIIENQQKLKEVISRLEPFPNVPEFTELRAVQNKVKYKAGTFTLTQVTLCNRANSWSSLMTPHVCLLKEVVHFLSVTSCGALLLTRLEGLKQLSRQLRSNKGQMRELLRECHSRMPIMIRLNPPDISVKPDSGPVSFCPCS